MSNPTYTLLTSGNGSGPPAFATASTTYHANKLVYLFIAYSAFADPVPAMTATTTSLTWANVLQKRGATGNTADAIQLLSCTVGGADVTGVTSLHTNGGADDQNLNNVAWAIVEVSGFGTTPQVQVGSDAQRSGGSAFTLTATLAALGNSANGVLSGFYSASSITPTAHSGDGYTTLSTSDGLFVQAKSPGTTIPRADVPGSSFEYIEGLAVEIKTDTPAANTSRILSLLGVG